MSKRHILITVLGVLIALGYVAYQVNSEFKKASILFKEFNRFEDSFKKYNNGSDNILKEEYAKKNDPKAMLLKNKSSEIILYLETMKDSLIHQAGKKNGMEEVPMLLHEKAIELKLKLTNYKNFIHTEFAFTKSMNLDSLIPITDRKVGKRTIKWETDYFELSPLAGVMTVLTLFQNRVREVEKSILSQLK